LQQYLADLFRTLRLDHGMQAHHENARVKCKKTVHPQRVEQQIKTTVVKLKLDYNTLVFMWCAPIAGRISNRWTLCTVHATSGKD
jgi:hypothetical protein